MYQLLKCILTISSILNVVQSCTITNVTHQTVNPHTIYLQWDLTDDCEDVGRFRVSALHHTFLACSKRADQETITTLETTSKEASLTNLLPFSLYKIEIQKIQQQQKIVAKLDVSTPPSIPQFRPSRSVIVREPYTQALDFFWAQPSKDMCKLRFGQPSGYRVELWGDDPWVHSTEPKKIAFVQEILPSYYAQKLLPYTKYRLKVFILNSGNLYNGLMPLELTGQTMATVPEPPVEIYASPISNTSVNLKWIPKYPPNGQISLYTIRVGTNSSDGTNETKVTWRKMIELLPNNSQCNQGTPGIALQACFNIEDLNPDTVYHFQVQVTNENISQSSPFSKIAITRTGSQPREASTATTIPTTGFKTKESTTEAPTTTSTSTQTSQVKDRDGTSDSSASSGTTGSRDTTGSSGPTGTSGTKGSSDTTGSSDATGSSDSRVSSDSSNTGALSTTKILIIAFTILGLIILGLVISYLFYKIKMTKLKIIYQQSHLGGAESYLSSSGYPYMRSMSTINTDGSQLFFGTGPRSKSISGRVFGPPGGQGLMSGPQMSMTTTSFMHSVANQIEEIQSRRLPEPPPTHGGARSLEEDSISDCYVNIENGDSGNGTLVSRFNRGRPNQHPDLLDNTSQRRSSLSLPIYDKEEMTDTYGYLKPTFHRFPGGSGQINTYPDTSTPEPIPVLSYESANVSRNEQTSSGGTSPTRDATPTATKGTIQIGEASSPTKEAFNPNNYEGPSDELNYDIPRSLSLSTPSLVENNEYIAFSTLKI